MATVSVDKTLDRLEVIRGVVLAADRLEQCMIHSKNLDTDYEVTEALVKLSAALDKMREVKSNFGKNG